MNRHNYSIDEIEASLRKDVVQRLLKLIRFRNDDPAFDGEFRVLDAAKNEVRLSSEKGDARCTLFVDLKSMVATIDRVDERGREQRYRV